MNNSLLRSPSTAYKITCMLGRGQQGSVHCAQDVRTGTQYAVKTVDISSSLHRQAIQKEVSIHQRLRHQNVIKYHESFTNGDTLYIILECGQCNLATYLDLSSEKCLNEAELVRMLKDVCRGIQYIHECGIIHRDIKIDNVILKHNVFKISDFGVSTLSQTSQTFVGTPLYLAPEVLNNQYDNDAYDKSVDIWSLGVLAFEAYFGISPFFYQGTTLVNQNHFEVINDNILNICCEKFQIRKIVEKLWERGMRKEASFIAQKALLTSKQLMYIFERIFIYSSQKRATITQILELLQVISNLQQMNKDKAMKGEVYGPLFRDDELLKYIGGSNISSSKSDTSGSLIRGTANQSLLRVNSLNDNIPGQLTQSVTYQQTYPELTEAQRPPTRQVNQAPQVQPSYQPNYPYSPQPNRQTVPQDKGPFNQLAIQFVNLHVNLPNRQHSHSLPQQVMHADSLKQYSPILIKNVPQININNGSPNQMHSNGGSPNQTQPMNGFSIQDSPDMKRKNSLSPIVLVRCKTSQINFVITTRDMIMHSSTDNINMVKNIVSALQCLIISYEQGKPKTKIIFQKEANDFKKLDEGTRKATIKRLLLNYYCDLSKYASINNYIVQTLYRLLICSAIGEISNNLEAFMTQFKPFFKTDNAKFSEIERFAKECTVQHLAPIFNYIKKCYP